MFDQLAAGQWPGAEKASSASGVGQASNGAGAMLGVEGIVNKAPEMTYSQAEEHFNKLWREHMLASAATNAYPMDEMDLRFSSALNLDIVRSRHFCVIGVGGIGAPIVRNLVGMGARNITIIDYDTVEIHNVGPQGYALADIGKFKVKALYDEIMRHRGISITAINFKIESYDSLLSKLGGTAPDVLIMAIDNLKARTNIMAPLFSKVEGALTVERNNNDNMQFLAQVPSYLVVTAMTLGLWNVYTLPFRAITLDFSRDGGMSIATAKERLKFIREEVRPRLFFKEEEAVQESCTARAIIYTGSTIAGYVCAQMHWFCQNEAQLNVAQNFSEFTDMNAVSENPFKWLRVFNARTFQDGLMSPAMLAASEETSKVVMELMATNEKLNTWKSMVRKITGVGFPDGIQDLLSQHFTGMMVKLPKESSPLLRLSDGSVVAREDLWLYVVMDYHNTQQMTVASCVGARNAMMLGQVFGTSDPDLERVRGKLPSMYGILFDEQGNVVCPISLKTEDERGADALPCGYSTTREKGASLLSGGGAFKSLMWGVPRDGVIAYRTPSNMERRKARSLATLGIGDSLMPIEDMRIGDVLQFDNDKKKLAGGMVFLGVSFHKIGIAGLQGVAGMPENAVAAVPAVTMGLFSATVNGVAVSALDARLQARAGRAEETIKTMLARLQREGSVPGFVCDEATRNMVYGSNTMITKLNTVASLSSLVSLQTGDPYGVFTAAAAAEASTAAAEESSAPAAVEHPWDTLMYSVDSMPLDEASPILREAMWVGVFPVSSGMRVQWKAPGDSMASEDVVGRLYLMPGAPDPQNLYVELLARQAWIRADACLEGVVEHYEQPQEQPILATARIEAEEPDEAEERVEEESTLARILRERIEEAR